MSSTTPPRPVRAFVLDMDGVLVASLDTHWRAYQRTFRPLGREFSREEYRRVAPSSPREVVIRRVLGELPPAKLSELMQTKERHVAALLEAEGVPTIPGVRDFLRRLRERGVPTAVATSSRSPGLFLAAADLDHEFTVVVDRSLVERPKPAPDCYELAARQLGIAPEHCAAVEDTPAGIDAALAGGMQVIALTTTDTASSLTRATVVHADFDDIDLQAWIGPAG